MRNVSWQRCQLVRISYKFNPKLAGTLSANVNTSPKARSWASRLGVEAGRGLVDIVARYAQT
jgi:hypothetical protein